MYSFPTGGPKRRSTRGWTGAPRTPPVNHVDDNTNSIIMTTMTITIHNDNDNHDNNNNMIIMNSYISIICIPICVIIVCIVSTSCSIIRWFSIDGCFCYVLRWSVWRVLVLVGIVMS